MHDPIRALDLALTHPADRATTTPAAHSRLNRTGSAVTTQPARAVAGMTAGDGVRATDLSS